MEVLKTLNLFSGNSLAHHGIKGQRWGVRRFQDTNGRLTSAGKQRLKDQRVDRIVDTYAKLGKAKLSDLPEYPVGSLYEYVNTYGETRISGLSDVHDFIWQEYTNYSDVGFKPTAEVLKDLPGAHRMRDQQSEYAHDILRGTTDYDVKNCNPGFGRDGTTQNCAKCSTTMEMRLRGWDVHAGRQTYPSSNDAPSLWFKDAKRVDYSVDDAEEALRSYGRKTSGTLSFRYPNNMGGHMVHWTNDAYGNFTVEDGQNGSKFGSIKEMLTRYGGSLSDGISTYRLDNCEPDFDAMAQDGVIRRADAGGRVRNRDTGRVVSTW